MKSTMIFSFAALLFWGCSPTPAPGSQPDAGESSSDCTSGGVVSNCAGRCIDSSSDPLNCGACGVVCPSGSMCSDGECTCPGDQRFCDGACQGTAYFTTTSDCGACGNDCGAGGTCNAGTCECATGTVDCNGSCRNTATDTENCGTCGTVCAAGSICTSGVCFLADFEWAQWTIPAAAPAPSVYTTTADTVSDTVTRLEWQRTSPATTYTWADAKSYCQGLTLGAKTGWRLPTLIELSSIVNYGTFSPAIDTVAFPNTPAAIFWSSSPYAGSTSDAWVVNFDYGNTGSAGTGNGYQVRCVR